MDVVPIVEGHGEVSAVPVLLRRISDFLSPDQPSSILTPIRVQRARFLQNSTEFNRMLQLANAKCGLAGWILILIDADDDCPTELARRIRQNAYAILGHDRLSVVIANKEYEAWFIASANSLNGHRGFQLVEESVCPESIRGAKEWMGKQMEDGKYRETTDQPAFSALMNLEEALANSRSFQKLCKEWDRQVAAYSQHGTAQ